MTPRNLNNDVINYGLEALYAVGDALDLENLHAGEDVLGTPAIQQETELELLDYKTSQEKIQRIKRSRQKPTLELMAQWPDEAHRWWKKLKKIDQTSVLMKMSTKYGKPFVDRFLEETLHPSSRDVYDYYFGLGMGPEPERIMRYGYKLAQQDTTHDWWVDPEGITIVRQRKSLEQPKEDKNENLPLVEAQNYAEDFMQGKNKIIEQINQLRNNVGNAQYPTLYNQFWRDFQDWQEQLNLIRERTSGELKEEIQLFNPDSTPQLNIQIDRLNEVFRWKVEECPQLVKDLPVP